MNYLSKPITGLTTKISQLFSGRVSSLIIFSYQGDGNSNRQQMLSSAIENKSASVSADGTQNIPPSAIPSR